MFDKYKGPQNKIGLNDYMLMLQNTLSIDPNIAFFENRADVERFTDKTNSFKFIMNSAKHYFFDYLGISSTLYPTPGTIEISYDVYWEFFDYILKMSPDFYIEYNIGGEEENLFRLRRDLEETVAKYKRKLANCQSEFELGVLKTTIQKFEQQLKELEFKIRAQTDVQVRQKRRMKVLREIFIFYCKQHITKGKNIDSFDNLGNNVTHMSVGDWMCFARDFGIKDKSKLDVKTLTDHFKKMVISNQGKDLINFDEFLILLEHIAEDLAVNVPFLKTREQKLESLYEFLDLMDPKIHRRLKKLAPAFQGTGPVVGPTPKEKEDAEAQKLFRERQERKLAKMLREKVPDSILALAQTPLKKDLQYDAFGNQISDGVNTTLTRNPKQTKSVMDLRKGIKHPVIYHPLRASLVKAEKAANSSYLVMERKKHLVEGSNKIDWQRLEKMKLNDLKGYLKGSDFEPGELLGEEEPEDRMYLAELNMQPDRNREPEKRLQRIQSLMNYGV